MPQVDLETLVTACAGGSMEPKIACETQPNADEDPPENETSDTEEVLPADFPPESFWLSKDAEYDWFDRNAFYERKDSTKGNTANLNPNSSNNSSQRFSMGIKSKKSAIIGLPKTQKTNFVVDSKHRRNCKLGKNGMLFPKRSGSVGKSTDGGSMIEPSSPKVSCMGRVRSKRDRKRRLRNRKQQHQQQRSINDLSSSSNSKPVVAERTKRKLGFLASFKGLFRHGRSREKSESGAHAPYESPPRGSSVGRRGGAFDYETASCDSFPRQSTESEPPGLGGMKRFVSGRRSGGFVGDVDVA